MASAFLLSFILDNMEEFQIHTYAVWTQKKTMTCIWQMLTLLSKNKSSVGQGCTNMGQLCMMVSNMKFAVCQRFDT
jgi:hypothetical protein